MLSLDHDTGISMITHEIVIDKARPNDLSHMKWNILLISFGGMGSYHHTTFSSDVFAPKHTQSILMGFPQLVAQMKATVNISNLIYSVCTGGIYYMFYGIRRPPDFSEKLFYLCNPYSV